jgi:hypothetical protein
VYHNHLDLVGSEEAAWARMGPVSKVQPLGVYARELVTVLFAWDKTLVVVTPSVEALWVVNDLRIR